jgi:hypothetical protein
MVLLPDLHEKNLPLKVIDDVLKALMGPPFDCEITLPSRDNDPEWNIRSKNLT